MKLELVIKNLIQNNKIKTQIELTDILSKENYNTTQSNISRILKKLNTVKIVDENKETYYVIQNRPLEIAPWVKNLIQNIIYNPSQIIIKTYSGSANLIGQILDERNIENIMANIAGDNTILVIVEDFSKIQETVEKLKDMFMEK